MTAIYRNLGRFWARLARLALQSRWVPLPVTRFLMRRAINCWVRLAGGGDASFAGELQPPSHDGNPILAGIFAVGAACHYALMLQNAWDGRIPAMVWCGAGWFTIWNIWEVIR